MEIEQFELATGRKCTLHRISNDVIPHYYLLGFPKSYGEPEAEEIGQMLRFGMTQAKILAQQLTADPEAFTIVYSGYSARREKGWHVHIFLLGNRWRKARMYFILSLKNLAQALGLRKDDAPRIGR